MDHYKETFETWNTIAQSYEDKFMNLDLYNASYDFICTTISKRSAAILEIGCGPGNITKYLVAQRPDFHILGIDIAPNMITLAKKNNPTANFAVMDSRNIEELKTTFDGIVCGFCLPYLSPTDSVKFLTDCYHLLNENGLLYLSFVEGDPTKSDFQTSSSGHRSFFYFYDLENLKIQLKALNFKNLQITKVTFKRSETVSEIHTLLTANK